MKSKAISKLFDKGADKVELWAGSPYGIVGFLAWCAIMPRISIDAANYGISVYTAALLVVTIRPNRRSFKALHAKVDDLEDAIEEADSTKVRLEDRDEDEIEACRK